MKTFSNLNDFGRDRVYLLRAHGREFEHSQGPRDHVGFEHTYILGDISSG